MLSISVSKSLFATPTLLVAPIPAPIKSPTSATINSSKTNCQTTFNLLIPIVLSTPISYLRSRMLIILMTKRTTPPIIKLIIKNVNANVPTFVTPSVVLSTSFKLFVIV